MQQTKRRLYFLLLTGLLIFTLAACKTHSSVSYTFIIENGDKIKATMDTSGGYTFKQKDGQFAVEKDEASILDGVFLTQEMYDSYITSIRATEEVSIVSEAEKDGNAYIFYQFNGAAGLENTFILFVKDSHTGVLAASLAEQEEAQAAFERLKFEKA